MCQGIIKRQQKFRYCKNLEIINDEKFLLLYVCNVCFIYDKFLVIFLNYLVFLSRLQFLFLLLSIFSLLLQVTGLLF